MFVLILRKIVGSLLVLVGIYVGIVALAGEEPWMKTRVFKYGAFILAWVIGGLGLAVFGVKPPIGNSNNEDT
jgi:hypothetical protein